ncbi:hypothetical protein PPL_11617 [Heterostelium album PN500]|uniref:Uncharacterized protein n=1 Tax=Heterostelium pallidum (strain ATCC 26659 / Pp 5 / PN500) TaxID=670386 RepID=D3BV91_HETP5|nr:hypothetical protein PPL_11617 [Heterostelium album PN500]EFA74648.1 hypothetical protein PPL_11617 [Heterostelium album PN500]|eukprot:XP_020426782.1 hypothetical protein PPL_11617 [Heterostelium album PN500]
MDNLLSPPPRSPTLILEGNTRNIFKELAKDNNGQSCHMTMASIDESMFVNRCFEGDLVIDFGEVSSEQRISINRTIESIKEVADSFDRVDSVKSRSYLDDFHRQRLFADMLPHLIAASMFSAFQIEQIRIHPLSLGQIVCRKYHIADDLSIYKLADVPTMIANNFTKQSLSLLGDLMMHRHLDSILSLGEYSQFDRNGFIFKAIRKFLNKSDTLTTNRDRYQRSYYSVNLARYLKNNELEILVMEMVYTNQFRTKRYIYGKEHLSVNDIFNFKKGDEAKHRFNELYKELTNREYKQNDLFPPGDSDEFFGHFESIIEKRYHIPSMKQICYSVLSEMFLMYVVNLYMYIESMFSRHRWFRRSVIFSIPQSLTRPPYDANLLFNVYESRHLFKPKQLPEANLLFSQKVSTNPLVLQDKQTFLDNFKKNTDGFFEVLGFKNMVIIGGVMTSSLTGETVGFESSDIDVCFYGLSATEVTEKIREIVKRINANYTGHSITYSENELTFCRHYPYRHIQFNCSVFNDIQDVLLGVDIEASCFAFDGTSVWTTQRGIESFNYRANFATSYGHVIRGDQIYQRRLLKVGGLPYGPNFNKVNFDIRVTNNYNNNYDGYNSSDWPSILKDIKDLDYVMPSKNILTNTGLPFDHFLLIDKDDQFHSDTDDYEDDE